MEFQYLDHKIKINQYKNHIVAVLTSGGDSQGMNAALRAIVRTGLFVGCKIYCIKEGYQGLINGGDSNIFEANWCTVSSIIQKGGTILGSARCNEFKTEKGKLKAVENLIQKGISNLVVIGGDGTLIGARELKKVWSELLKTLLKSGKITKEKIEKYSCLRLVGLVGTIDNDFPFIDMTIGTDSALHRIQETIDSIVSTASSHRRAFILELMGNNCGYLALKTALTCEADYVFLPECPQTENWPEKLVHRIHIGMKTNKRFSLILLAEGAIDCNRKPICAKNIKKILDENSIDSRITVLGHVQRGGSPSAFDRILASRLGTEAILTLLESKLDDEPIVICFNSNKIEKVNLEKCINMLEKISQAIDNQEFELALKLKERSFIRNIEMYTILNDLEPPQCSLSDTNKNVFHTVAIINLGKPTCGMNAVLYSVVRYCLYKRVKIYGIFGSIEGLLSGDIREIKWNDVTGLLSKGGSYLGTTRILPSHNAYEKIAENLKNFNIEALVVVGGFTAFHFAYYLYQKRDVYQEFCIPIAVIPVTISNNVPGVDFSIGSDTALNAITATCDLFKQYASGTKSTVFVVETMGHHCGYLCTLGAISSEADLSYIFEENFTFRDLINDVCSIKEKISCSGTSEGLILRNEMSNDNYTTDFITNLFSEEGKNIFRVRKHILGYVQEGITPSSFDRSSSVKLGVTAAKWILSEFEKTDVLNSGKIHTNSVESVCVMSLRGNQISYTSVQDSLRFADFKNELNLNRWWMHLRPLLKLLEYYSSGVHSIHNKKE